MNEKKSIKVSVGTVVCIFIIILLAVALGIVYYMGFVKNNEKISNLENEKKQLCQQYNEKISNLENENNKLNQQLNTINNKENKQEEITYEEITQDLKDYEEITQELKDDEIFYVVDYKDNADETYTLYGVIYRRLNNIHGGGKADLIPNSYKKVTVSSSLVIDLDRLPYGVEEPHAPAVEEYFSNFSTKSKIPFSINANENGRIFGFTFKNGKCTEMYYKGLGI